MGADSERDGNVSLYFARSSCCHAPHRVDMVVFSNVFLCLIIGANVSPILVLVEAVQDQITRKHPQSHRRRAMSATGVDSQVDLLSIVAETHSLIPWC